MKNKVCLITGAGRGIGEATAKKFAAAGYSLVLISRTADQLMAVRKEILNQYSECEILCLPADVSVEAEVVKVYEEVLEHFGRLHCVVNNAGSIQVLKIESVDMNAWKSMIDINLTGTFLNCREAIRRFSAFGLESILNISSLAGVAGLKKFPGFSAYSAAKAGVIGLTEALAEEVKSKNIRVNCLAPGAVDTQMLREALPNVRTQTKPDQIAEIIFQMATDQSLSGITTALEF